MPMAVDALENIDLQIGPGEQVAIIGPSGAGKIQPAQSAGHRPATYAAASFEVLRHNRLAPGCPPAPAVCVRGSAWCTRRRRCHRASGWSRRCWPARLGQWGLGKGLMNLLYPLDIAGARAALARLDLSDKLFTQCQQLSGGQLQRVGIARVLYQAPEVLLADEPVSAMDPVLAEHTLSVLCRHAREHNVTLVASLHAVELALSHFPRIIGLRDGQILFDLPASEVDRERLDSALRQRTVALPTRAALPLWLCRFPRC